MMDPVALPDPTALDDLRARLGPTRRPIGIRRIAAGPGVLDYLVDDVAEFRQDGDVLVVMDRDADDARAARTSRRRWSTCCKRRFPPGLPCSARSARSCTPMRRQAPNSTVRCAEGGCVVSRRLGHDRRHLAKDASCAPAASRSSSSRRRPR